MRGAQSSLSPSLGAPATPAAWQAKQACLYSASPAPEPAAATTLAGAAAGASATAEATAGADCRRRDRTSRWRNGFGKFAARRCRHVNHRATDFQVFEVTAALRTHSALALERRLPQHTETGGNTGRPSAGIAEFRSAGHTCRMTRHALGFINLFAGFQRPVGITDFNHADLLDALGHRAFGVLGACQRFVGGRDVINEADDGKNRNNEREENRCQQLLGGFDRASMGFLVGRGVVVSAHGVLEKLAIQGCCGLQQHRRIIAVGLPPEAWSGAVRSGLGSYIFLRWKNCLDPASFSWFALFTTVCKIRANCGSGIFRVVVNPHNRPDGR